jgi:hypothetical protein
VRGVSKDATEPDADSVGKSDTICSELQAVEELTASSSISALSASSEAVFCELQTLDDDVELSFICGML